MEERIQKFLAHAGIASRREAEEAVRKGLVLINGEKAIIGQKVTADDAVEYKGKLIEEKERKVYYMLNKPIGYVTTMSDVHAARCVADLLNDIPFRVYPVGRLDRASEGMLLITNDGELALRLTHPRYDVEKTYLVRIKGAITSFMVDKLTEITHLDGKKIKPIKVQIVDVTDKSSLIRIYLSEGRNRQIRRMCKIADLEILGLKRVAVGELKIGNLKTGEIRKLTSSELKYLQKKVNINA